MIVWVSGEVTSHPNNQRFEILDYEINDHAPQIRVRSCGNGELFYVSPKDIVGFEIGEGLTIRTKTNGWST